MSAPTIVKAAATFLKEDERRKVRPKLTPEEKQSLAHDLMAITGTGPVSLEELRPLRGEVAARLFGYQDRFDEIAANVITDILHAAQKRGYDPLPILARARGYYFQEVHGFDSEEEAS